MSVKDPTEELLNTLADAANSAAIDREAGHARIGGLWAHPDYMQSYLAAARVLVHQARSSGSLNELGVACAYLQRHTLELAIKDLLGMLHAVADNDDSIARITGRESPSTAPPPGTAKKPGEREHLRTSHDLDVLLADLRAARQREIDCGAQYAVLPADLERLVEEFDALEKKAPERFRYESVRPRGVSGSKRHERSFPEEIVLPVAPLQARLDGLIDELFGDADFNKPNDSLARNLADVLNAQTQRLWSLGYYDRVEPPKESGG